MFRLKLAKECLIRDCSFRYFFIDVLSGFRSWRIQNKFEKSPLKLAQDGYCWTQQDLLFSEWKTNGLRWWKRRVEEEEAFGKVVKVIKTSHPNKTIFTVKIKNEEKNHNKRVYVCTAAYVYRSTKHNTCFFYNRRDKDGLTNKQSHQIDEETEIIKVAVLKIQICKCETWLFFFFRLFHRTQREIFFRYNLTQFTIIRAGF